MADQDRKTLALEVCALDRAPAQLDVTEVTVPGVMGIFVVLPGHAPLLSNLEIGSLTAILADGTKAAFAINGGVAQVLEDHVLILSKTAESEDEIDVERAERALSRAEERLKKPSESIDIARAEVALKRALTRLNVAGTTSHTAH